ncbi:MAG TPA: four helix bundle protein [Ardenticatenaceae bacterium]
MSNDLRQRTKAYALRIIKLYTVLPKTTEAQVIGKQFLRSGTSVGAHYHEAYRSRSDGEYVSKVSVAVQELEETAYWLELLTEADIMPESRLTDLLQETSELTAIFVTGIKKIKDRVR